MTRYLFPQDRETFLYTGPGEPIRQAGEVAVFIYANSAATTLASIQTPSGITIDGSFLVVGDDGMLPEFKGPDGVVELWAKTSETPLAYRVEAKFGQRLTALGTAVADVVTAMDSEIRILVDTDGVPYLDGLPD